MTLNKLIYEIAKAYPAVAVCWDPEHEKLRRNQGDTLAEFVTKEIAETYDASATEVDQLIEASVRIRVAKRELTDIEIQLARLLENALPDGEV